MRVFHSFLVFVHDRVLAGLEPAPRKGDFSFVANGVPRSKPPKDPCLFALERHCHYAATMKTILEEREQFIVNATGQRVGVLLDLPTYERLREAAEDNAEIRSYRAAKPRVAGEIARGEYATLADYGSKRSRKSK